MSPLVVNQSAGFPPLRFAYCSRYPWSSIWTSMPHRGSWPGGRPSRACIGTHANTPEFPAAFRWRHSITSSKFVKVSRVRMTPMGTPVDRRRSPSRSEEHTSELQSRLHLVCRLLLEKKKKKKKKTEQQHYQHHN